MTTATCSASPTEAAKSPRIWGKPPVLIKWLFITDVIIALLAVVAHFVSSALGMEKFDLFRLGQENNLPTWYSSSQLLGVALLLMLFAYQRMQHMGRFDWRLLLPPAFFLFLSLDETASIHERMGEGLEMLLSYLSVGTGMRVGTWTLICAPLFLIGLYIVGRITRPFWAEHPSVKWKLIIGLGVAFVSAVGGELIMAAVPPDSIAEKAETFFEELGEMVGVTILVWAAWDLLNKTGNPLTRLAASKASTINDADQA